MRIDFIETIPMLTNIEVRFDKNEYLPKGLGKIWNQENGYGYYFQPSEDKPVSVEIKSKQDKNNVINELKRCKNHFCFVKISSPGRAVLDMYFFQEKSPNFGEIPIFMDSENIAFFKGKEFIKEQQIDERKIGDFCKNLPFKCALKFSGKNYFIILDAVLEPGDNKRFSILAEHKGKLIRIDVQVLQFTGVSTEGKEFFKVDKIAPIKNITPLSNYRLVEGSLIFSNSRNAIAEVNSLNLQMLMSKPGSYLKAWQAYTEARGLAAMNVARNFGCHQFISVEQNPGCWKLFFKDRVLNCFNNNFVDAIEIVGKIEKIPLFIKDPKCSFTEYYENKKLVEQQTKDEEKTFICDIEEYGDNWISIIPPENATLGKEKKGKVVFPKNGFVTASMLGEFIQIERQNDAWEKVASGKAGISYLGNLLEGEGNFIANTGSKCEVKISDRIRKKVFKNPPTDKQLEAIRVALNTPDIALIQGPPGTGKTTVINAILEILNEIQDKRGICAGRVAATAYQHAAVKNMAERISINSLPTLTFGNEKKGEVGLKNRNIDEWCDEVRCNLLKQHPEYRPSEKSEMLDNYLIQYIKQPSENNKVILLTYIETLNLNPKITEIAKKLKSSFSISKYSRGDENYILQDTYALRTTVESFKDDGLDRINDLLMDLEDFNNGAYLDIHPDIESILNKLSNQTNPLEADLQNLMKVKTFLIEDFKRRPSYVKEDVSRDILDLCKSVFLRLDQRENRNSKKDRIMNEWLEALKIGASAFNRALREINFVYAATTQQIGGKDISNEKKRVESQNSPYISMFDTVIIDEAARATPPDLLIPMCKAAKRIVLVGDHRQLPQMVEESLFDEVKKKDFGEDFDYEAALKCSLFECLFTKMSALREKDGICRAVTLDKQYRTHPLLGDFCSKHFYECHNVSERYESPRPASDFSHSLPGIENKAAIWINVPNELGKECRSGTSLIRPCEAECIAQKIRDYVLYQKDLPRENRFSFGVISFYKKQSELIKEQMENLKNEDVEFRKACSVNEVSILVDTVDAFQGREFDVVFLSVVRSNHNNEFGFLKFPNRLCVSMSRQKNALIVVGDGSFVTSKAARMPNAIVPLADFFDMCADSNNVYSEVIEWTK